jgi:hypothetical protein
MTSLDVRYAILFALEPVGQPRSVADVVADVTARGVRLGSRSSKRVSDLLRTECSRGRVERVGWGTYRLVSFPRRTRGRALVSVEKTRARNLDSDLLDASIDTGGTSRGA